MKHRTDVQRRFMAAKSLKSRNGAMFVWFWEHSLLTKVCKWAAKIIASFQFYWHLCIPIQSETQAFELSTAKKLLISLGDAVSLISKKKFHIFICLTTEQFSTLLVHRCLQIIWVFDVLKIMDYSVFMQRNIILKLRHNSETVCCRLLKLCLSQK